MIKLYAWELPFQKLVSFLRDKELSMLKKSYYLNSASAFLWRSPTILVRPLRLQMFQKSISHVQVSLATFATYTLINQNDPDQRLTAERAFVSLSIFNIIHGPLSDLSDLIPRLIEVCDDQESDDS